MASPHSVPKVEKQVVAQISKAPKWLKRSCGASFAVSFLISLSFDELIIFIYSTYFVFIL